MESVTPLNTETMESEETLGFQRESPVTDDRAIYDELIAPLPAAH
jgi:hypothetical protein